MLKKLLEKLAGTPETTIRNYGELEKGNIAVEGVIRTDEPIKAPIGGANCAGFYYKCTHKVPSRLKGYIRRKLRDVLSYAPGLTVKMKGGVLPISPRKNQSWTEKQHRILLNEDYMDFKASEKIIRSGDRVRVVGKARKKGDGEFSLEFSELYLVKKPDKRSGRSRKKGRGGVRRKPSTKRRKRRKR